MLAACCDIRIAGADAQLAGPEVAPAVLSGRREGPNRSAGERGAKEPMCIGEPIDAEIARAGGRVTRVVPPGPAPAAALDLARELAERPIRAPQLLKDAVELAEDDAIRRMLGLADAALRTEDARAGVHAFFAKEAPPVAPPVRRPHACAAGPC